MIDLRGFLLLIISLRAVHGQTTIPNLVTQISDGQVQAPFPQEQTATSSDASESLAASVTDLKGFILTIGTPPTTQPVGIAPWNTQATPTLTTVATISGKPMTVTVGPDDEPIPLFTVTQDNGGVFACVETIYTAVDQETACIEGWTQTIIEPDSGTMTPFGQSPGTTSATQDPDTQGDNITPSNSETVANVSQTEDPLPSQPSEVPDNASTRSNVDGITATNSDESVPATSTVGGSVGNTATDGLPPNTGPVSSQSQTTTSDVIQITGEPNIFANPSQSQTVITESGTTGTYSLSTISEYGTLTGTTTVTTHYPVTKTDGSTSETTIPVIIGPGGVRWTPVCSGILCPGGGGGGEGGEGGFTPPCLGILCGGGGGGGPPNEPEDPNDPKASTTKKDDETSTDSPSSSTTSSSTSSSSTDSACILPSTIWPLPSYTVEDSTGTGTTDGPAPTSGFVTSTIPKASTDENPTTSENPPTTSESPEPPPPPPPETTSEGLPTTPPPPPKPSHAVIIYHSEFCSESLCSSSARIFAITPGEPVHPCSDKADYQESYALDATNIDLGPFKAWEFSKLEYHGTTTEVGTLDSGIEDGVDKVLLGLPCIEPAAETASCALGDEDPIVYCEW
ncbi:MAG: hypothetical protein Q9213_005904 [Squamulea squamosa]